MLLHHTRSNAAVSVTRRQGGVWTTQVHKDFEYMGVAANLATLTLYGGTPYDPQTNALRRGVDVVVGTPGRIKDHLERGTLDMSNLKCGPALSFDQLTASLHR
jgi:superfamily II DNA/RNA helicase